MLFVTIFTNIIYSQYSDELYFVKSYSFGNEINRSTTFFVEKSSIELTIMLSTIEPINLNQVYLQIFRYSDNEKDVLVYNQKYNVEPEWDYTYFGDIVLSDAGDGSYQYIAVLKNTNGDFILSSEPIDVFYYY